MSNLTRGIRVERKLARELRGQGYAVTRAAASKGAYDLIALNRREVVLVSVKCCRTLYPSLLQTMLRALRLAKAPRASVVKRRLYCWVARRGWVVRTIF